MFHYLSIFNFFFLLFSLIHTRTRLLYLTPWYLHYSLLNSIPSLWDLYTLTDTLSYLFMISSFFLFFYSHTQLISVFHSSLFSLLYSPLSHSLSLSLWWVSKFVKHDCVSHTIPLVLILLFFYKSSYEAKDYSVFEERNDGIDFGLFWRSKFNFMCNKLIPAESFISGEINRNSLELPKHTRIGRNHTRGGIKGLAVPVSLSVRNFSAISAETKRYP